ncbi:MAG: hypothetical protein ACODAG_07710, partial [Myxococcota bacterium]
VQSVRCAAPPGELGGVFMLSFRLLTVPSSSFTVGVFSRKKGELAIASSTELARLPPGMTTEPSPRICAPLGS